MRINGHILYTMCTYIYTWKVHIKMLVCVFSDITVYPASPIRSTLCPLVGSGILDPWIIQKTSHFAWLAGLPGYILRCPPSHPGAVGHNQGISEMILTTQKTLVRQTHRINVWYIYLHERFILMVNVGKYTSYQSHGWYGKISWAKWKFILCASTIHIWSISGLKNKHHQPSTRKKPTNQSAVFLELPHP